MEDLEGGWEGFGAAGWFSSVSLVASVLMLDVTMDEHSGAVSLSRCL